MRLIRLPYFCPYMASCLALLLCAMLAFSCNKASDKEKTSEVTAQLGKAESVQVVECRSFPAQVESQNSVTLASKFSGAVLEVFANEGTTLKLGDPILRIDDKDLKNREQSLSALVNQAQMERQAVAARAVHSRANLDRLERLAAQKVISQDDLEKARSEYQAIKSEEDAIAARASSVAFQRQELKSQTEYTRIVAPFSGVLARRYVDQGAFVTAGQPLALIDDVDSGFELTAQVDESLLGELHVGQTLVAAIPGLSPEPFAAKVSAVIGRIDPQSRSFKLKLEVPLGLGGQGATPKAGMFGRVFLPVRQTNKLLLPQNCLGLRGDLPAVFVTDERKVAHLRIVKTGGSFYKVELEGKTYLTDSEAFEQSGRERFLEVLSGLQPGETLACGNTASLREGDIVREAK